MPVSTIPVYKAVVGPLSLQHDFEITIPNLPGADGFLVKFLATGATIPAREVMAYTVDWHGRHGEMPAVLKTDGDFEIEMNIDSKWKIYDQLMLAHELVANPLTGAIPLWKIIAFDTNVKILDPGTKLPIKQIKLIDCFLKTIGSITKAHSSETDKDTVSITIHHDDWVYIPIPIA